MQLHEILRKPLVTEKNADLQALGKYAFEVAGEATKQEISQAVETAFKVKVTAVNTVTYPGKAKRMGRRYLPPHPWKKAIVTLKPGDKIELFENV